MKKFFLFAAAICLNLALFAQKTYVYFENSTSLNFTVTSTQTGTHTLESSEWWYSTANVSAWQDETNVLWTNRDAGIHWGDDFFLTTTLTSGATSIDLKLKLHGDFIGSTIWSAAAGPGFSHNWSSDYNFHSEVFTVNGKQYELKYTFYFTGGYDDILFTLHEFDAFTANAAELSDPNIMNVLAYNTFMLTPPISLSNQGTRALHIDEAVHNLDAILIQEVFDNSARATLLSELSAEYPYQTAVVDLPNLLEDGGIMIASRWPIEYSQQMVWNNCNAPDCLANKGVMYARINKLGKKYHLFSTHQQAYNGSEDVATRNLQMQQFSAFIDAQNIPSDEAVIFGGDLNVDKHTNKLNEYNNMLAIFNASEPTYLGHNYTWDKYTNHYIDQGAEAPEYLDYVLADNDYLVPTEQSNTVWIMRSNHDDMWNIHDLSDHHAILGRFVYPSTVDPCEGVTVSISGTITDESFAGASDGSIDISVSGGTLPYTYSWSNGGSSEDLAGLSAGVYSVDVTDANGCSGSAAFNVQTGTTCTASVANFAANPLTHSGSGSASTTLSFPANSQDVSFDITDISQKTGGKADRRYIEQVTVTYVDGSGSTQTYGTYSGASVTSASIAIGGAVQSVSIALQDSYSGSTTSTMSISMTAVDYCVAGPSCPDADGDGVCDADDACPGLDDALIGTACNDGDPCTENDTYDANCACNGTYTDSDGDGVCDANDICPGGDDSVDTDGDGIPDFCDGNCTASSANFAVNPLTHTGTGATSTTLALPAGSVDVDFSVSNIDSKLNGKTSGRYNERVVVTYIDGAGSTQTYGTFEGTGTAAVSISGAVQSITLSLSDAYDGNPPSQLSVNMSAVAFCSPAARTASASTDGKAQRMEKSIELFPNPAANNVFIRWNALEGPVSIQVYSIDGKEVMRLNAFADLMTTLDVSGLTNGLYMLQATDASGVMQSVKFIKQ